MSQQEYRAGDIVVYGGKLLLLYDRVNNNERLLCNVILRKEMAREGVLKGERLKDYLGNSPVIANISNIVPDLWEAINGK